MIVTKTPLRVSFFGGGSDLPQYYSTRPGMVLSTTIDRTIQIAVNKCDTDHCRVIYSTVEIKKDASQIKHDRVREILKLAGIKSNIEICSFSDVSTKGTGLGSSSSFTVGLVNALSKMNTKDLAELACYVEINLCGESIGKQDQYAAAYGGFNCIRFHGTQVDVEPVGIDESTLSELNDRLMCFPTGLTRNTSDILKDQIKRLEGSKSMDTTSQMVELAEQALVYLRQKRLDDFGSLLDESWTLKKSLAPNISNYDIDVMYELGMQAGALGGKVLGAGGGGYMLFYVPERSKERVLSAMALDYKRFNFRFTNKGSEVFVI